jgi:hypothetical protein
MSKSYWVGYEKNDDTAIVLTGPFGDLDCALGEVQRVRSNFESAVKVSLPFIAHSEIQAVKMVRDYL